MTLEDTLTINQQVELVIKSGAGVGSYRSRVEELTPEAVYVATPFYKGYTLNFRPGEEIEVNYVYNQAAVYIFQTYILEIKQEPLPLLGLAKPKELHRIQRRSFVRMDAHLPLTYSKLEYHTEIIVKNGPYQGKYQTRVEDFDENLISLYLPTDKDRYRFLPLTQGTEVEVIFTLIDGTTYSFVDTIKNIQYRPVPIFVLDKPMILRNRDDSKGLSLPMEFKHIAANIKGLSNTGETKDISGGGLMFKGKNSFSDGDQLEFKIDLPGFGSIRAFGEIIRCQPKGKNLFENSIKFTQIFEGDRDKIVQYIFNRQTELRRKGLL